jgi:hypothetical protein
MLRNPELLRALKQSPIIKNVSIVFPSQHLEDLFAASNCSIPLDGFVNLTSLQLFNLYGAFDALAKDIAAFLGRCPSLKSLGLGIACKFSGVIPHEPLLMGEEVDFLEKLCIKYEKQAPKPRLELETLRLGQGMFHRSNETHGEPRPAEHCRYPCSVGQMNELKIFHIYNGLVTDEVGGDGFSVDVGWAQLDDCKTIRQLSVTRLETDVLEWLSNGGQSVQELIVTEHYSAYDPDLENFDVLRLPQLSMLFVREMSVPRRTSGGGGGNGLGWGSDHPILPLPGICSLTNDARPEEALPPQLDPFIMTVLDRLHDNGAQLIRLGLCLDMKTQWASIIFI